MLSLEDMYETQRSHSSTPKQINPHSRIYRVWGKPISKVLIVSIGCYYGLQLGWKLLESNQREYEKNENTKI